MKLFWRLSVISLLHLCGLCHLGYNASGSVNLNDYEMTSKSGLGPGINNNALGLNFVVLGDWGGLPYSPYRTDVEQAVSKTIGAVAEGIDAQFVVALGDNFYFDGVEDVNDDRFQETFENVFTAQSLQVPWYVVAGNHDHHRNVSAQIDYSQKSQRWNFPNYYYSKLFQVPDSNRTLQLVLIDTVQLCGNIGHDFYPKKLKGPEFLRVASKQWQWLEKTLEQSTADYLVVGGHYPVWSISHHGPTQCLVDQLQPMLQKYRATSYICGHDHNLQHLTEANSTVGYFVIGSANFIDPRRSHESDLPDDVTLKFFWADYYKYGGFAKFQATQNYLNLTFINSDHEYMHNAILLPRRK